MKRVWSAFGILLLVAGAVLFFWRSNETSIGHTATFSDGTTFTLKDVNYGTEHRLHGGGLRERLIKLLPQKWARRYVSRQGVMTSTKPTVTLWFEQIGTGPPVGDPHIVVCDETGFGVWGVHTSMPLGPTGNRLTAFMCDSWPRRDRYFTVRVYESIKHWGEAKPIGEFKVRNPTPGKYSQWIAEPFPITRRQGDLSVTLLDLVSDVGSGSLRHQWAGNPIRSRTRADFHIKQNDQLTTEWGVISTESSDATGNLIDRWGGSGQDGDITVAELQPHPWPAESAWKLRVGVSRKSNFDAAELWTLRVPLSDEHVTNRVLIETNLQGTVLSYAGQRPRPGHGLLGNRPFYFHVPKPQTGYVITFVKAKDQDGRPAVLENYWQSPTERIFGLTVNTNSKSLDLTVALHRTRYFEFVAHARIFSTNETIKR
jgi:hypothetical protein